MRSMKNIELRITELGNAAVGSNADEVVIGLSPSFGVSQRESIEGLSHGIIIRELMAGIEEEGMHSRFVKFYNTSDLSSFANEAARLSGSGIAIGIQSKGTTVIHQKDLVPLDNLELFPQAPLYNGPVYRHIGRNAAKYAKGETPVPVPALNDQMALSKYQIKAALLQIKETELVVAKKAPVQVEIELIEWDEKAKPNMDEKEESNTYLKGGRNNE